MNQRKRKSAGFASFKLALIVLVVIDLGQAMLTKQSFIVNFITNLIN